MANTTIWRRLLACATIDVLLITATASAIAAPAVAAPASTPALPALLLIGVGLCGSGLRWRGAD